MKILLIVLSLLVLSSTVFAGFGGGRASGGFSGGRSSGSSFGGSRASASSYSARSYSAPARSAPASVAATTSHTTVINNRGGSYGSGNGFVTGMLMGHMLSQPSQTVIAPVGAAPAGSYQEITQPAPTHGAFYYFFSFLLIAICIAAVIFVLFLVVE